MNKQLLISISSLVVILILIGLTSDLPISPKFLENNIFELIEDEPVVSNLTLINIAGQDAQTIDSLIEMIQEFEPSVLAIDLGGLQREINDSLLSRWSNEGITFTGHNNSQLRTCYIKSDQIRSFTTNDSLNLFEIEILKLYDPNSLSALEKRNTKTEMINYIRPTRNFEEWEGSTLLKGLVSKSSIGSKIVILGYMGEHILDHFETSSVYSFETPLKRSTMQSESKMYGIEISANIIWMILRGNYIKLIPKSIHYLIVIVIAILCSSILVRRPFIFYWGLAAIFYLFFTGAGIYLTVLFLIEYNVYIKPISYHYIFLGTFVAGFIYKVIKYKLNEYNKR